MLGVMALLALQGRARADPQDVEEGEPVSVEDAFTDPVGQLSIQYSGVFTHAGTDLLEQGPTFKLGAFRHVQISVNPNYDSGSDPARNAGNVLGDVLVQINEQSRLVPAFAVDVFYSAPFGAGQKQAEWMVRAIGSKSVGDGADAPRVHVNVTETHVVDAPEGTRADTVALVVGASAALSAQGAVVGDVVYGAADDRAGTQTTLEAGYSRDLPQDWTLQLGVGRQVAGARPATRVFFAVEKELQIF